MHGGDSVIELRNEALTTRRMSTNQILAEQIHD
jgi:hypothetical protein